MATWDEFAAREPGFAERIERIFDAHIHKTMATLRRDGSPRISGTEVTFKNGELWLGGGTASVKVRDLMRDPRVAVHCAPIDTKMVEGDAKLSGRAVLETDESVIDAAFAARSEDASFFRLDIDEAVLTRVVDAERLDVELWTASAGLRVLTAA